MAGVSSEKDHRSLNVRPRRNFDGMTPSEELADVLAK
jgi:hypothetical protein